MRRNAKHSPLAVCILVACGSGSTPATTPPVVVTPPAIDASVPVPDPVPPGWRLPTTVRPTHHDVALILDPANQHFNGTITMQLEVAEPTSVIWLHGRELKLKRVALAAGTQMFETRPIYPSKDMIGLVLSTPLPRGKAKVTIEYAGVIHPNDGTGIYTGQDAGAWYLFTQFQITDAREAFPCFDEPSFKAPWKLAIQTKKDLAVFGNAPIVKETDLGTGWKTVELAETKPMPSYLVAFAIGPFDVLDAGKSRGGAPLRVIVPKGRGSEGAYAVEATKPILDLLEDYFGTPYPFEKLDTASFSVFNWGAMENPGLITWREDLILTKPTEMTVDRQQIFADTQAHEIAHMWFGDLVTLAWWDDAWLNEAFATWMEDKVLSTWKPAWEWPVHVAAIKSNVMMTDSLDTARAVRQPIESATDLPNAFDEITYRKGEMVIAMIESYVGVDVFKEGVRAYLAKHAWGNATYTDFLIAVTGADFANSKGDRYAMQRAMYTRPIFDSFITQPGVPLVDFDLQCKPGRAPFLEFAQRRYAPTGSKIDPKRTWTVPICVRWGVGAKTGRDCTTLYGETMTLSLSAPSCPDWLNPNESSTGYYRANLKGKHLDNLIAKAPKVLSAAERIGLVGDIRALVAAGRLDPAVALGLVESLAKEKRRHLVEAAIKIVEGIDDMVADEQRPKYEAWIKKVFGPRVAALGFTAKRGEDDQTKKLRPALHALVAVQGRDVKLIAAAADLAWKWFADRKAIEPEMLDTVLAIAAKSGDRKLFERMHSEAKATKDPGDRRRLLVALGMFVDQASVEQAMSIALTGEFDLRDTFGLVIGGLADRKVRPFAFQLITKHIDAIFKKLPETWVPFIPASIFTPLCDDANRGEIEATYKPRFSKLPGGARALAQALEGMELCAAAKKAQAPGIAVYLKRQ